MTHQQRIDHPDHQEVATFGKLPRLLRWITLAVVCIELVLLFIGRISLGGAIGILLVVEAALLAVILTVAWRAVRTHRGSRVAAAVRAALPGPVAALVLLELGQIRALWLMLRGREHTEHPEDTTIPYAAGRGGIYLMLAAVCVIELLAVHLIVPWHRLGSWAWLQWLAFALSAYAVIWLLAWWAAQRTHPHLITAGELVLRNGATVSLRAPVDRISSATSRRRGQPAEDRLTLGGPGGGTNLDIDLLEPVTWQSLTGRRRRQVSGISLEVDDPELAVKRLTDMTSDGAAPPGGQKQ